MQAVYRPYVHPRLAKRLAVPVLAAVNTVGAASTGMTASVQAAGVVLGSAAASVSIDAQAQEGSFFTHATASASVAMTAQAKGINLATAQDDPAGMTIVATATGRRTRAGEATASVSLNMTLQATGVAIVPGAQPGAAVLDMANFIERKVERAAEYRFSGGGITRDFFQRGN